MRETIRIDLTRPVTNRKGEKQNFVTIKEPNLGDLIECQETVGTIYGAGVLQEAVSWPAVGAYLKRLLTDVSYEVLCSECHPAEADKFVKALAPFMPGASTSAGAPSDVSSSSSD